MSDQAVTMEGLRETGEARLRAAVLLRQTATGKLSRTKRG